MLRGCQAGMEKRVRARSATPGAPPTQGPSLPGPPLHTPRPLTLSCLHNRGVNFNPS